MQKIVGFAVLCASCWTLAGVAAAQNTPPADTGTVIRTSVTEVSLDEFPNLAASFPDQPDWGLVK